MGHVQEVVVLPVTLKIISVLPTAMLKEKPKEGKLNYEGFACSVTLEFRQTLM